MPEINQHTCRNAVDALVDQIRKEIDDCADWELIAGLLESALELAREC